MDLIDKLPDLQSKKDYLSKLKESLTQFDKLEMDLKDYKSLIILQKLLIDLNPVNL